MKVLALNGSPNKNGNTYQALQVVAAELEAQGITVETITISDKIFSGCTGCRGCRSKGSCVLPDQEFQAIMSKVSDADGLILGSPVYYGGINGTMKCFLDRAFFSDVKGQMRFKVGASVAILRRNGGLTAFEQLNTYLMASEMIVVPSQWMAVFGAQPGEIHEDKEGMQRLHNLGKNMAWVLNMKDMTKETLTPPAPEVRIFYNFIRTDGDFKP